MQLAAVVMTYKYKVFIMKSCILVSLGVINNTHLQTARRVCGSHDVNLQMMTMQQVSNYN
jgi:hypothetical protein